MELALQRLESRDEVERCKALRQVKNSIIGNATKKAVYVQLGAIPRYHDGSFRFFHSTNRPT